jgi:hypothetical protein
LNPRATEIRDTTLLAGATVLGVFLSPLVSLIGLPVAAAGIAGLVYRGKTPMAAFAAIVGLAAVAVAAPADLIFAAPALVAVVLAVVLMPLIDFQLVGLLLMSIFGVAGFVHDTVVMRAEGTNPAQLVSTTLNQALAQAEKSAGPSATPDTVQRMREVAQTLANALPTFYFVTAFVAAVVVVVAVAWVARRSGRSVKVPALSRLDLSPYILLPFVAGVLAVAAGYSAVPYAAVLGIVGLNLVLCVRMLFLLQGLGVAAGVLDRTGVGLGGRIFALAVLAALDALTMVVSFTGLLDFWINFRRLPREGAAPTSPVLPDDGRRW